MWQKSVDFVTEIYRCTALFPSDERYGLTSQMRRAAVSLPSNIAEGASRESTKNFLRFIAICNGSLAELQTQLVIAKNLGFITSEILETLKEYADEIGKMLNGLRKSLVKKLDKTSTDNTDFPAPVLITNYLPLTTNN